jgi:hypothetical protein
MSSDKECRVLEGEEDMSEKKVLKEGSEADQSADNKCLLEVLRALYIFAMAEVNVVKRKRTSS